MLFAYGLTAALTALDLVSGAVTHIKGHIPASPLGTVSFDFSADGFSARVTDNVGIVSFDDGRQVKVAVVYPGNDALASNTYDPTYGYNGASIIAIGADAKGLLALTAFRQDGTFLAASTANSDASDLWNIYSPTGADRVYKFTKTPASGAAAAVDLDISVPLAACTDCICPSVKSSDGVFSLETSCVGRIADWQMTAFNSLVCTGDCSREGTDDFLQLDALLVKGGTVCLASIFATAIGANTKPITLLPFCFGGAWPSELNHWQGTVGPLTRR